MKKEENERKDRKGIVWREKPEKENKNNNKKKIEDGRLLVVTARIY